MKGNKKKYIAELEEIMRSLADVWPTDRDNVAIAGAKFEEVIEGFDKNFGQLQKLIDLAWSGLRHLYEKDEYFMSVKANTLQAVNTIREYLINDGDIAVEDFEKAYFDLEKSLSGGGESADKVIELEELNEAEQQSLTNVAEPERKESESEATESSSLNDLASYIMMLDEESATEQELKKLHKLHENLGETSDKVAGVLDQSVSLIKQLVENSDKKAGWLLAISKLVEQAIDIEAESDWNEPVDDKTSTQAEPVEDKPSDESIVAEQEEEASESDIFYLSDDIEIAMLGEFVTECSDLLEMAESALLDLEASPDNDELINTVFRSFHTIKGTSAFMGLSPISEFTHSVETLLSMVRDGDLAFDSACADITLESIDIIKQMLTVVETAAVGDALHKPNKYDSLLKVLDNISNDGDKPAEALSKEKELWLEGSVDSEIPAQADTENRSDNGVALEESQNRKSTDQKTFEKLATTGKTEVESTVRVNVSRLDRLIDMVGELVIAHSVVAQDKAIPKGSGLQKKVNHATKILRELQDTSLTLRMVPLKATFHKMNRLVRDLTRKARKSVNFSTFGEDTEIDRNMVDIISEPLVHMIRNAIDHGIEDPESRARSGKPSTASISLRASQEGGKVVIEIEDDGRGINKDKILAKAINKGLIDPDKNLTEKEIYNLIFLPGFSSVDKVTDLSGRGVGMDVVRRSIEQLQGKVDVTSELGKGTTITLELPFTLAITDGMLVSVGNQRYIVPTINIDMTFRAKSKNLFTVLGSSEQVSFRGQSVPVVRLHDLFGVSGGQEDLLEGTLIVVRNNNKRYALLVDEVIGQQQLVGKSINMMVKMKHISGGAILGDGRVGLILDTAALMLN